MVTLHNGILLVATIYHTNYESTRNKRGETGKLLEYLSRLKIGIFGKTVPDT